MACILKLSKGEIVPVEIEILESIGRHLNVPVVSVPC
jgi:hypothetical protein